MITRRRGLLAAIIAGLESGFFAARSAHAGARSSDSHGIMLNPQHLPSHGAVDPQGIANRPILRTEGAQMASLSTHVLDIEAGVPAAGVPVRLTRLGNDGPIVVASGTTDHDGRISDLAPQLAAGAYQLDFDVAAYLGQQGRAVTFLRRIVIEFEAQEGGGHYHVPLLASRYACTSYRGS